MPLPTVSFEEAIDAGAKVIQHRLHTRNDNYSVHVAAPGAKTFIYTNVSHQRLRPYVCGPLSIVPVVGLPPSRALPEASAALGKVAAPAVEPSASESPTRQAKPISNNNNNNNNKSTPQSRGETFETAMMAGARMVEVKRFVTYGALDAVRDYINIDASFDPTSRNGSHTSSATHSSDSKRTSRRTNLPFEECLKKLHGSIILIVPHEFYSVHVKKANGKIENFNRVSPDKYKLFRHLVDATSSAAAQHYQLQRQQQQLHQQQQQQVQAEQERQQQHRERQRQEEEEHILRHVQCQPMHQEPPTFPPLPFPVLTPSPMHSQNHLGFRGAYSNAYCQFPLPNHFWPFNSQSYLQQQQQSHTVQHHHHLQPQHRFHSDWLQPQHYYKEYGPLPEAQYYRHEPQHALPQLGSWDSSGSSACASTDLAGLEAMISLSPPPSSPASSTPSSTLGPAMTQDPPAAAASNHDRDHDQDEQ
ncbi:hypothetical protein PhCBS80983_g02903 [Powellomyces hirtus]|uniref:Uncharacterized protein n=1 Tax=Powellomyces hirtus TaxID=109895 RepID=A0A507E5Y8_9FUNG|nr:hypothetical protein PhCBS80983_g02903 [Powellomyces hirtus]